MHNESELLIRIKRKYKLEKGSIIDIKLFDTISESEDISPKDLRIILEINSNKWSRLKNGKQKYVILKFNTYEEINYKEIFQKEEISYNVFLNLSEYLKLKPSRLKTTIGIYASLYKKLRNGEVDTVRVVDMKLKHKVDLIRLDMEYMNRYKIGYYSYKKLSQICEIRNIKLDDFLKFYNRNPKCYELNKLTINNIDKIWLGKVKIPDKFINEHYNELYKRIEIRSNYTMDIYNCKYMKEELIQDAISEIYENCGNIVKNFYFDNEIILNILAKKAKYIIMNACKKERNFNKNVYYDKFEHIENSLILSDHKYNPQKVLFDY